MAPHHVWYIVPGWGHHTAGHATMVDTLEANPELKVTFLHHVLQQQKVDADFATYPPHLVSRINFVPTGSILPFSPENAGKMMHQGDDALKELIPKVEPAPTKFILDQAVAVNFVDQIREAWPKAKVILHWTPSAMCYYNVCAPLPHGARGFDKLVEDLIAGKEVSDEEKLQMRRKAVMARNGHLEPQGMLVKIPGLPEMYDYEREAENIPAFPTIPDIVMNMVGFTGRGDGTLLSSSICMEKEAIAACNEYIPTYALGAGVTARAWKGTELKSGPIKTFLDQYADKQVVFISFGSVVWPTNHLDTLIDVLVETKQPFLLAWGGAMPIEGKMPPGLLDKIKACGHGFFQQGWFDQVGLLNHPSIGWFITHCGWNSILESTLAGVPMIAWPLFHSDEPQNAAWVSTRAEPIGFELCQIRMGYAQKPAARGINVTGRREDVYAEMKDVLERGKRPEGEKLRTNVKNLGQAMRTEKQGTAREACRVFASE